MNFQRIFKKWVWHLENPMTSTMTKTRNPSRGGQWSALGVTSVPGEGRHIRLAQLSKDSCSSLTTCSKTAGGGEIATWHGLEDGGCRHPDTRRSWATETRNSRFIPDRTCLHPQRPISLNAASTSSGRCSLKTALLGMRPWARH